MEDQGQELDQAGAHALYGPPDAMIAALSQTFGGSRVHVSVERTRGQAGAIGRVRIDRDDGPPRLLTVAFNPSQTRADVEAAWLEQAATLAAAATSGERARAVADRGNQPEK